MSHLRRTIIIILLLPSLLLLPVYAPQVSRASEPVVLWRTRQDSGSSQTLQRQQHCTNIRLMAVMYWSQKHMSIRPKHLMSIYLTKNNK